MSLRYYMGPSGAGKSTQLYKEIIARSGVETKRNFLVVVPDQFTMQTQKDMVMMHPNGGIMNIDVLSFGRLAHRIFEEVGGNERPVLDDTGKSLILRALATKREDELKAFGKNLNRQGYIHEIKSVLSEFIPEIPPVAIDGIFGEATEDAVRALIKPAKVIYHPQPENKPVYDQLYTMYCRLHDYFGRENDLMSQLKKIQGK